MGLAGRLNRLKPVQRTANETGVSLVGANIGKNIKITEQYIDIRDAKKHIDVNAGEFYFNTEVYINDTII